VLDILKKQIIFCYLVPSNVFTYSPRLVFADHCLYVLIYTLKIPWYSNLYYSVF